MTPTISVVIATKNEEKNIERCLRSVFRQEYDQDKLEIIVVDNDSKDRTAEIARRFTDKVFQLSEGGKKGKIKNFRGAQVNLGVDKSSGDIIFFPDADMTFDPGLFSEIEKKLQSIGALFIPEVILGVGYLGSIRNFERGFYNTTAIDGVRALRRETYVEMGGFDVENISFGPDDWDLTKALKKNGYAIGITDRPLFHHEEGMGWKSYIDKKAKYAGSFDGYIEKWGKKDPDIKKQLGLYYRYFGVFLEQGKWRRLFRHPLLAIGMYFLKIVIGFKYLMNVKE